MKRKGDINFDLKQLRSFLLVIQENSFTRASRNLKIGQSTISHHINSLEEMLGTKLIERTSKEFYLTVDGKIFQSFCENLFNEVENLKINFNKSSASVITNIGASTIPSTYIIPEVIAKIRRKHSDFFFNIDIKNSREVIESVKDGKCEIGVIGKIIKHPSLKYSHIYSDEIVLVAPSGNDDSIHVGEIKEIPLISREKGSGTRTAYENELKKHKIKPSELNIVFECSTSEAVKESVIAGIGYSFISRLAIGNEIRLNKIKVVKVENFKIYRDFYAVSLRKKSLLYPSKMLLDKLISLSGKS